MSNSTEAKIVELPLRQVTQEEIAAALTTGRSRISRSFGEFHYSGIIPHSHRIGRPSIRGSELITFVETRTLQTPSRSGVDLAHEVSEYLNLAFSHSMVNAIHHGVCSRISLLAIREH
jgi:hypothetical protein